MSGSTERKVKSTFGLKIDYEHQLVRQVIVLDKNKDGRVGLSEFGMLIRAFNKALSKGMPPMQVVQVCKKMYAEFDEDGNGIISYDEAYASWKKYLDKYFKKGTKLKEKIELLKVITSHLPEGDPAQTQEILQRHEFRRQFHILDKAGTMLLGHDEYFALLLAYNKLLDIGKTNAEVKRDVARLLKQIDADNSGSIDLEEAYRQFKADIAGIRHEVVMDVMRKANDILADNARYCPDHQVKKKSGCKKCQALTARILASNNHGMFEFLRPKPPSNADKQRAAAVVLQFEKLDINGDGTVDKSEVHHALLRMGIDDFIVARYTERVFTHGDKNNDGVLSLEEFKVVSMRTPFPKPSPISNSSINFAQLKNSFVEADKDKNGKISPKELKNLLTAHGATAGEAQEMTTDFFSSHDKKGKGEVDFEAFKLEYVRMATFRVIYTLKCLLEAGVAIDEDVDGQLSRSELFGAFVKEFGNEAAEEQVDVCFDQMDTDKSGFVTLDELWVWYQSKTGQ